MTAFDPIMYPTDRKTQIENAITDMISDFLYYDRKEDEDLPRGAIEDAIKNGEISVKEIIIKFGKELNEGLDL